MMWELDSRKAVDGGNFEWLKANWRDGRSVRIYSTM